MFRVPCLRASDGMISAELAESEEMTPPEGGGACIISTVCVFHMSLNCSQETPCSIQ